MSASLDPKLPFPGHVNKPRSNADVEIPKKLVWRPIRSLATVNRKSN